ncbi:MAG TPA: IPTL-CTERM sorting domain-containing protein [Xanthomonadales bacterium]|nr:IPTL-CTERM sorting domain-containing protein [Xanthomonadales bacterium]
MRSSLKLLALGLALTISSSSIAQSLSASGDVNLTARGQQPLGVACGPLVLNQSTSQVVTAGSSVRCGIPTAHADNNYFRAFSLGAFPTGFSACAVRLGIEIADAAGVGTTQPLTVRIYSNTGGAFPAGTRTQVGTATAAVADQALSILEVPVTGLVPPGAELIAEVFTPNGQVDGHSFFLGANGAGQSGPSYIQAADCGVTAPTSTAAIGFPNAQFVLSVLGSAPGGGAGADLAIVMTDAPDPVTAGTNLNYTVTMTNTGPDAAQNARFTVPLPAGTTLVSTTPSAGGVCTAVSPIVCTWAGATANAAVRSATIVATVAANTADGAFLNSSATAASDTPDADPADNLSTVSTAVVTAANLSLALTDAPDPVNAGTNLTYTATLSQAGPSDAQNARFSVEIPAETTFVSSSPSAGGACVGTTTVTCTWAGATVTGVNRSATIVVSVPANLGQGTVIVATATASSDTVDPTPGNNAAAAPTTVNASADLSITLTDVPDPVVAGTNLSYTATLTNGGPSDAQAATITLPLPAGTSFVSATPSAGGSCNAASPVVCTWAGATAPAGVRTANIVAAVSSGQVANLSATATASSTTTDPTPGNNTATATTVVEVRADLGITLTDAPDPVIAGTQLTYTAVVSNAGPSDATAVVVTLPTPANTSFVSGSVTGGGACAGSPVVCTVTGSMLPGSSRTVTIVMLVAASAPEGSTISATATVSAGSPDPNPANNTATTTTAVITRADLALTFSASVSQVLINVPVTFTAVSLNQGPSDAQGVSVTITLTPDFRYAGHTAAGATCTTPQVGNTGAIVCTWAGATVPGATRTLVVTAFSNTEGPTAVNASTTSTTIDPDTSNNFGNITVQVGYLVEEIPTLSGLGLILMGLLFGLMGFVAVRREA